MFSMARVANGKCRRANSLSITIPFTSRWETKRERERERISRYYESLTTKRETHGQRKSTDTIAGTMEKRERERERRGADMPGNGNAWKKRRSWEEERRRGTGTRAKSIMNDNIGSSCTILMVVQERRVPWNCQSHREPDTSIAPGINPWGKMHSFFLCLALSLLSTLPRLLAWAPHTRTYTHTQFSIYLYII